MDFGRTILVDVKHVFLVARNVMMHNLVMNAWKRGQKLMIINVLNVWLTVKIVLMMPLSAQNVLILTSIRITNVKLAMLLVQSVKVILRHVQRAQQDL